MATTKKATTKKPPVKKAPVKRAKAAVKKAVEKVDTYTEPVQQDAAKAWKPLAGKIAIIGVVGFVLFMFIRQGCNKKAIEENNEKISVEKGKIDSIYSRLDSLDKKDSVIIEAIEVAELKADNAQQEADKTQENLNAVKVQTNQKLQTINKNSNEILKKLNNAPNVRAIDDIFDSIERSRAKMFQN